MLIIDFFSHGLRSVKIEQELEKDIITSIAEIQVIIYVETLKTVIIVLISIFIMCLTKQAG
jgi:hypothetical protein